MSESNSTTDAGSLQDSFISHLIELRDRLVKVLGLFGVIFAISFFWPTWSRIYTLFAKPLMAALPAGGQMISTDIVSVFLVPMKISALASFLVMLPFALYQLWAFVAPGLYQHEKRLVIPLVFSSTVLFFVGMAFAYFLIFPMVFKFMASVAPEGVAWMTDIDKYFGFALSMFLVFGFTFEVPVIVVVLVRMNIVTVQKLAELRPYMVVVAFVLGAIFTPPDVVSQLALAIPLCILYEIGIIAAKIIGRSKAGDKPSAGSEDAVKKPE